MGMVDDERCRCGGVGPTALVEFQPAPVCNQPEPPEVEVTIVAVFKPGRQAMPMAGRQRERDLFL